MNLLEKWKNRETKKKLREENIRLKTEIEVLREVPKPPVCTVERNIQRVAAERTFRFEEYVPADTREYLDSRSKPVATRPRQQRTVKSGRSRQTQNDNSNQEKDGQDLSTSYDMGGCNDEKV